MDQDFDEALGKLISELASRPVDIDRRRVRWCLDRGISPFVWCADGGCEAWQLVSDEALGDEKPPPANFSKISLLNSWLSVPRLTGAGHVVDRRR